MKKKRWLSLFLITIISACTNSKPDTTPKNINRELFGIWDNDNGCSAKYAIAENKLILVSFNDSKGHVFKELTLDSKKEGIATKFNSINKEFTGSYIEGALIIDNYCTEALHKIGN